MRQPEAAALTCTKKRKPAQGKLALVTSNWTATSPISLNVSSQEMTFSATSLRTISRLPTRTVQNFCSHSCCLSLVNWTRSSIGVDGGPVLRVAPCRFSRSRLSLGASCRPAAAHKSVGFDGGGGGVGGVSPSAGGETEGAAAAGCSFSFPWAISVPAVALAPPPPSPPVAGCFGLLANLPFNFSRSEGMQEASRTRRS